MAVQALVSGQKTVTTAGSRVAVVASETIVADCVIRAMAANTGKIYVGSVLVSSSVGYELSAGESVSIASLIERFKLSQRAIDLGSIYIDSSVNGEKVCFMYVLR